MRNTLVAWFLAGTLASSLGAETTVSRTAPPLTALTQDGYGFAVRLLKKSDGAEAEVAVDRWDQPLPIVAQEGRFFLPAQVGKEFGIQTMVPNNAHRMLFVITVDGINIIDGKDGSSYGRGYVVNPSKDDDNVIPGWRRGNESVARFVFERAADSYAARTNRKDNIGVIGVQVYAEREKRKGTVGTTRGGGNSKGGTHDLGTAYGREAGHHVTEVFFERGNLITQFELEYASSEALAKVGIMLPNAQQSSPLGTVDAFPGDRTMGPVVPPPPGWRRNSN